MQNTIPRTRPKGRVHKLAKLADIFQAKVIGDASLDVDYVEDITEAKSGDLSYIDNIHYQDWLFKTQASVICVSSNFEKEVTAIHHKNSKINFLLHPNPRYLFAKICQALYPISSFHGEIGIHPSVAIDPTAVIHPNVIIAPNCVIGKNVTIDEGSIIKANTVVGNRVKIGQSCILYPNVTIYDDCELGSHVVIHSGTVIGSDGFGFANEKGKWEKVPQLGRVIVGNHVEIGANTCIDRGALKDTIISQNVILDNLIQIAHNVQIGEGTAMAGCSAVAGSTKVGKYCLIGGSSRINGHIEITDKVTLLGSTNVVKSIKEAGMYASAINERPAMTWKKTLSRLNRLEALQKRVKALEIKQEES